MIDEQPLQYYSPDEEKLNIITHAFGFMLSLVALVLLIIQASFYGNVWHIVSVSIFATSLMILYAASTLYHKSKKLETRSRFKIFDHASIYVLIAGTYTPFTLVALRGTTGWVLFGIIWGFALTGIVLKLFYTGKYTKISTAIYVLMGWLVIFVVKPLIASFPIEGFFWLLAGGIAYTIGAIIYSIKKLQFNHAIFHIFVLIGGYCHFMSVYFYLLPSG
jgi:hemolysin III